jgi:hypothetical protein
MLAASSIGIFLVPMLYVVFQSVREGLKRRLGGGADGAGAQCFRGRVSR